MKQKVFFIIFQRLSVARNSLRHDIAPLAILVIETGLLCNFAKILKNRHFMAHSGGDFKF